MYTHILIPTDGSELAQKGIDHALSLAKVLGSKVTIVTATEPFPIIYGREWQPGPAEMARFEKENSDAAAEALSKVQAAAERSGVQAVTRHVPNQRAATAIIETSEREGCNLIVMSSHGRTGIVRAFLGSQTMDVITHSKIPVLVVR